MTAERSVRYADSGGVQIAYAVIGDGPVDILAAFEWASHLDLMWSEPRFAGLSRRFGEYARLIAFDLRGSGLSDPVERLPTLEEWADDVRALLDHAGSDRPALVGHGHAGQLAMLFAAMHPERTSALVLINAWARLRRTEDYPSGIPPQGEETILSFMAENWGTGNVLGSFNPGMRDGPYGMEWLARVERAAGSPRRAVARQRMVFEVDVRDVLPSISVPTLVVQSTGNAYIRSGHGRFLAEHIHGSRYLEVDSIDHSPQFFDGSGSVMDAIEEFLTGARPAHATNRALMTVAFTDIVGSTELAAELGDRRWRSLLEVHESVARHEVEAARGRLVKLTGDGVMATFDGPARAVHCMRSVERALETLGLKVRAGVHTGEVELLGDDIGGIAVHIASRVAALAHAGEVYVSSTVRDLVAGSGIEFEDRGEHHLKGVPGAWRVFTAATS